MTVYAECCKNYTKKFNIELHKKRRMSDSPSTTQCSPRKHRLTSFDIDTLFIFCGELASEEEEQRKRKECRQIIRRVSTISFKDTVI